MVSATDPGGFSVSVLPFLCKFTISHCYGLYYQYLLNIIHNTYPSILYNLYEFYRVSSGVSRDSVAVCEAH